MCWRRTSEALLPTLPCLGCGTRRSAFLGQVSRPPIRTGLFVTKRDRHRSCCIMLSVFSPKRIFLSSAGIDATVRRLPASFSRVTVALSQGLPSIRYYLIRAPGRDIEEILRILAPLGIIFYPFVFIHQSKRASGCVPVRRTVP